MLQASPAFAEAVARNHDHVSRCEIFIGSDLVDDTYYGGTHVRLLDGSVDFDRTADTRGSARARFIDIDGTGKDFLDPIAGAEVRPWRGILINGVPEWIPLGRYPIQSFSLNRGGTAVTIEVDCNDMSDIVRWLPWAEPFIIPNGTDYFDAIKMVIDDRTGQPIGGSVVLLGVATPIGPTQRIIPVYNMGTSDLTTPDMVFQDSDDPWAVAMKLAEAVGCEIYFDRYGVINAMPIPDPDKIAPVLSLVQGQTSIVLTPVQREASLKDVFNGVIVRGEAPWLLFPISGEAWDEDPLSPTYRRGPFGEKPQKIGDSMASTNAQCQVIAEAEFKKIKGVLEDITFNTMPDPRIEVGDVIDVKDDLLGVNARLVIETLSIPLVSGQMSGTVRRRR